MSSSPYEPTTVHEIPQCIECQRPHGPGVECPEDLSHTRPSFDEMWAEVAAVYSKRGDCRRRRASAIIVVNNQIVSAGYNGTKPGDPGCLAGFCPRGLLSYDDVAALSSYDSGPGTCIGTHAEQNAINSAARRGVSIEGGTMFLHPGSPCPGCRRTLVTSGIVRVLWPNGEWTP